MSLLVMLWVVRLGCRAGGRADGSQVLANAKSHTAAIIEIKTLWIRVSQVSFGHGPAHT